MKVYKYRGKENFQRDLFSLVNNQIFAAPFKDLNDPFEGVFNDDITKILILLERKFKSDSSEVIEQLEIIKDYKNKLGIYSLSTNPKDELLWAHYSSSHKGFCIEYDLEKLEQHAIGAPPIKKLSVDYKKLPQSITVKDISNDSLLIKLFSTKSKRWEYEEEIRLIFASFGLKKYHESTLSSIYFGINMSASDKETIIKTLINRDVKFYDTFVEENTYILNQKLVHENKRKLTYNLDPNSYEIVKTSNNTHVENFYVHYKNQKKDTNSFKLFLKGFVEKHVTKEHYNIYLIDDLSILPIIDKTNKSPKEYINFADHIFAISTNVVDIDKYPFKDFHYNKYCNIIRDK